MRAIRRLVLAVAAAGMMVSGPAAGAADLTPAQAKAIAVEAYVYTYPLVMTDMTRRVMTNVPPGLKPGLGPKNAFHHFRTYPPADFSIQGGRITYGGGFRADIRQTYFVEASALWYRRGTPYDPMRDRGQYTVVIGYNLR